MKYLLCLIVLLFSSCASTISGEVIAMYKRGGDYSYQPRTTWVYGKGYTTYSMSHERKQWFLEVKHSENDKKVISQVSVDSLIYVSSYVGKQGNF